MGREGKGGRGREGKGREGKGRGGRRRYVSKIIIRQYRGTKNEFVRLENYKIKI